jgi:imidazolonepropionase
VVKASLANAVDGFCEGIAFSVAEMDQVFAAAQRLGLPVKLHAEQLSNLGGARLAARYGALSVDHIEYLDDDGVAAIAGSGTVAVLLPGAFYYLKEKQHPPLAALRARKVPIAIATDLNPGSSPVHSLLATMNMACVLFGLTPEEALRGVTANAARALGFADRGVIAPGMKADLVLWDVERPGDLAYPLGFNPCAAVIRNGEIVRGRIP